MAKPTTNNKQLTTNGWKLLVSGWKLLGRANGRANGEANFQQPTTNHQQLLVGRCKLLVGNCKLAVSSWMLIVRSCHRLVRSYKLVVGNCKLLVSSWRLPLRRAFTLVEVLVTVGLIAVLSTAVLLTLNPLDFLKQGRDSIRLNDLSNLVRTLNYIQAESPQTFFGNPKTIYISRPDPNLTGDATSTCPNMNLPPIPSDWSYYCVSPQNLSKIDGKGWIPINFSNQAIFRLSKLPTDPQNNENYYYTYVYDPNTQTFEIDTVLESQKQKHLLSEDNGDNNNLYELGTNLTLYPIGSIGQNFALKNESNQFIKNESNYAIYVAQAAGTGQVSFFIAPDQVTGDDNLFWDNTNKRLGIWTTSPGSKLSVSGGVSIGSTYAGTAAPVDGMIIQGNVGIGTATPTYGALSIYNANSSYNIALTSPTVGGGLYFRNISFAPENPAFSGISYAYYTASFPDHLAFNVNSNGYQLTLFENGNVTIGTDTVNNSLSAKLAISGSGTGTGFAFRVVDASNTDRFAILDNGNVGIGTTAPTSKLYVSGDLTVTGTKNFEVDYPGDPTKKIIYVALEGPEAGTYIRGTAVCENPETQIVFPDYFRVVTAQNGLTANLTPRNSFSNLYIKELTNEKLIVGCEVGKSFDYVVFGVRKGYENFEVIRSK